MEQHRWKLLWWIIPIALIGIAWNLWQQQQTPQTISTPRDFNQTSDCEHLQPWTVQPGKHFVCRETYALSMNPETKMADYVAYCIDRNSITGSSEQDRRWEPDPDLPENVQLEPADYEGVGKLGYDRGHQAPLASFRGENWQETNYTSNITPQKAELNRGVWLQLEKHERKLVQQYGSICTITGPYYDDMAMFPLAKADEKHKVPNGYWKIISYGGKTEGYLYEQETPRGVPFEAGRACIPEIERYTGFDISTVEDSEYCP